MRGHARDRRDAPSPADSRARPGGWGCVPRSFRTTGSHKAADSCSTSSIQKTSPTLPAIWRNRSSLSFQPSERTVSALLSFLRRTPAQPKIEEATEHHQRHRGGFPVSRQRRELEIQFVARRNQVARAQRLAVIHALPRQPQNFDLPALQQPLHETRVLKEGAEHVDRYLSGMVAQGDPAVRQEDDLTLARTSLPECSSPRNLTAETSRGAGGSVVPVRRTASSCSSSIPLYWASLPRTSSTSPRLKPPGGSTAWGPKSAMPPVASCRFARLLPEPTSCGSSVTTPVSTSVSPRCTAT